MRAFYVCPECGADWDDLWDSACDEACTECDARAISPVAAAPVLADGTVGGVVRLDR